MKETQSPRYSLERIAPGLYTATDSKSGISVTFAEERFEATQQWRHPADAQFRPNALKHLCDGMEAWLRLNHPQIVSEAGKFILTRSEDGRTITISKPANGLVISFPASTGRITAAANIRAVAMWLKSQADDWDTVDF